MLNMQKKKKSTLQFCCLCVVFNCTGKNVNPDQTIVFVHTDINEA